MSGKKGEPKFKREQQWWSWVPVLCNRKNQYAVLYLISSAGVGGSVAWLPSRITGFFARLTSSMQLWTWFTLTSSKIIKFGNKTLKSRSVNTEWQENISRSEEDVWPARLWRMECQQEVGTHLGAPRLQQRGSSGGYWGTWKNKSDHNIISGIFHYITIEKTWHCYKHIHLLLKILIFKVIQTGSCIVSA